MRRAQHKGGGKAGTNKKNPDQTARVKKQLEEQSPAASG